MRDVGLFAEDFAHEEVVSAILESLGIVHK